MAVGNKGPNNRSSTWNYINEEQTKQKTTLIPEQKGNHVLDVDDRLLMVI